MPIEYETLVSANLALQAVLAAALFYAILLARRRNAKGHCLVLRAVMMAQIVAILALMSPAMLTILEPGRPDGLFRAEILLHHTIGLAVIPLWLYINLASMRIIGIWASLPLSLAMRAAAGLWIASLLMGFHIHLVIFS